MKDDRYRHPFYWAGFVLVGDNTSCITPSWFRPFWLFCAARITRTVTVFGYVISFKHKIQHKAPIHPRYRVAVSGLYSNGYCFARRLPREDSGRYRPTFAFYRQSTIHRQWEFLRCSHRGFG